MTQQIKNIEEHFHFQLNQLSIKTISSELKMKLHPIPMKIKDEFLIEFLQCIVQILPQEYLNEFHIISQNFNNVIQILSFYYNYYISQFHSLLKSNERRFHPISDCELEIKLIPIKLLFKNIYYHLKYLLVVNIKELIVKYNVNVFINEEYSTFLESISHSLVPMNGICYNGINDEPQSMNLQQNMMGMNQQVQNMQNVESIQHVENVDNLQNNQNETIFIGTPQQIPSMNTLNTLNTFNHFNTLNPINPMNDISTLNTLHSVNTITTINETNPIHHHSPSKKTQRIFLDKKTKTILKQWFVSHEHYPYPTETEKNQLSSQCNISLKQLNTWFANYRSRYKKKYF